MKFNIRTRKCKTETNDEHKYCTMQSFHTAFGVPQPFECGAAL